VAEAKASIKTITPQRANEAVTAGRGILLDVREPGELSKDGTLAPEHIHVPRGVTEAKADPESSAADEGLTNACGESTVRVVCASGARAAMAIARLLTWAMTRNWSRAAWRAGKRPVCRPLKR
jgi:rhodanese-related sulfurtransferase